MLPKLLIRPRCLEKKSNTSPRTTSLTGSSVWRSTATSSVFLTIWGRLWAKDIGAPSSWFSLDSGFGVSGAAAAGLPAGDSRRAALRAAAARHAEAALPAVTGEHYEGGHWLGTLAVYLVTRAGIQ